MALELNPEYENFAYVRVDLNFMVNGTPQKISLAKIGDKLKSVTVQEGVVSGASGGTQLQVSTSDIQCAKGNIHLYDHDNSVFYSLMASKNPDGQQLMIGVEVEIRALTGIRTYIGRLEKWTVSFSSSIPEIVIDWSQIGNMVSLTDSQDKTAAALSQLITNMSDNGVKDVKDFVLKIPPDLKVKILTQDGTTLKSFDIAACRINGKKVSFKETRQANNTDATFKIPLNQGTALQSILLTLFDALCANLQLEGSQERVRPAMIQSQDSGYLTFALYEGEKDETAADEALSDVVFLYNSSCMQGGSYSLGALGNKTAFIMSEFSCSMGNNDIVFAQLSQGSNGLNGNMILTPQGRVVLPADMPAALQTSINNMRSYSLVNGFRVSIKVYNFIQFYVRGKTPVHLVVFDHLGQVHPVSGKLSVLSYKYTVRGGALEADVELSPMFSNEADSLLYMNMFPRDGIVNGGGEQVVASSGQTVVAAGTSSMPLPDSTQQTSSADRQRLRIMNNKGYTL